MCARAVSDFLFSALQTTSSILNLRESSLRSVETHTDCPSISRRTVARVAQAKAQLSRSYLIFGYYEIRRVYSGQSTRFAPFRAARNRSPRCSVFHARCSERASSPARPCERERERVSAERKESAGVGEFIHKCSSEGVNGCACERARQHPRFSSAAVPSG